MDDTVNVGQAVCTVEQGAAPAESAEKPADAPKAEAPKAAPKAAPAPPPPPPPPVSAPSPQDCSLGVRSHSGPDCTYRAEV